MSTKLTDLTALGTTPAAGDLLTLVDVDDTTGGAEGTSKKVTYANLGIGAGGDDHFVFNGGGFINISSEMAISFGMSTSDSSSFSYITTVQIPINCRLVAVRSMSQSNGGSTDVRAYKPTTITGSVASYTALGTVNTASHTNATTHLATFDTSTYDYAAGDNLGITIDSSTNLNGFIATILLKKI